MAADPTLLNPLANQIFIPVVWRVFWVFSLGFLLILFLNKFRIRGLWKGELGKRYLTWLVLAFVYLFTIFLGGDFSLIILALLLVFAIWEFSSIARLPRAYVIALYFLAVVSVFVASYLTGYFYALPLIYFAVVSWITLRRNDAEKGFYYNAVCLYGLIWIVFSLSHFVLLGHLNNDLDDQLLGYRSKALLVLLGFAVPLSDVGAYVVGKFFSKLGVLQYQIASHISKNKMYIGVLGNILGALLGLWIMWFALQSYLPWWHLIILGVLIGYVGVVGDLIESTFKRYFEVKDSGRLLPGHGGILDRIDSLIRVVVVVYYYVVIFAV